VDRPAVASLFSEDGVIELPGNRLVEGRSAIAGHFSPRPGVATIHLCSNVLIEQTGESEARGTCHLVSYRHDGEPPLALPLESKTPHTIGLYYDAFVRAEGSWLFRRRRLVAYFKGR
jgi:hypothetical protein